MCPRRLRCWGVKSPALLINDELALELGREEAIEQKVKRMIDQALKEKSAPPVLHLLAMVVEAGPRQLFPRQLEHLIARSLLPSDETYFRKFFHDAELSHYRAEWQDELERQCNSEDYDSYRDIF
jgi:hypothetical protein